MYKVKDISISLSVLYMKYEITKRNWRLVVNYLGMVRVYLIKMKNPEYNIHTIHNKYNIKVRNRCP